MSDPKLKAIEEVNASRVTQIALDHMRPHFAALESIAVSKIKNLYRTGPHELATYMSCAAELVALEDLQIRLKASIRKGEAAAVAMHQAEGEIS